MFTITRRQARLLRAAVRRCATKGRPRGPDPVVCLVSDRPGSHAFVSLPDVILGCRLSTTPAAGGRFTAPMTLLAEVESAEHAPVTLERISATEGRAAWTDKGTPKSSTFPTGATPAPELPGLPVKWTPTDRSLLNALHEAGRCAADENGRYDLTRLQVRGKDGQVIGSDGKQALVTGGFRFPFAEDLHVPAVPVFGMREWTGEAAVRVGRSPDGLCVGLGDWLVWLNDAKDARFPDVAGVVKRTAGGTRLRVGEDDAAMLLSNLSEWPGADDEYSPVTLLVGDPCRARARSSGGGTPVEIRLADSSHAGAATVWTLNREYLHRALLLGFREFSARKATDSLVATQGSNCFLFALLHPEPMDAAPQAGSTATRTLVPVSPDTTLTLSQRNYPMKPPEPNPAPDPTDGDTFDPLAEAEALRTMLGEALARSSRLVAAMKNHRRQRKAIESAWSSLRQLNLGTGG